MTPCLLKVGDFVRRPDDKAKGVVLSSLTRVLFIVRWPNGTQSKHHHSELVRLP
jgi:hypothetical protein